MLSGRNWCELADCLSQVPEVLAGRGIYADGGGHKGKAVGRPNAISAEEVPKSSLGAVQIPSITHGRW